MLEKSLLILLLLLTLKSSQASVSRNPGRSAGMFVVAELNSGSRTTSMREFEVLRRSGLHVDKHTDHCRLESELVLAQRAWPIASIIFARQPSRSLA